MEYMPMDMVLDDLKSDEGFRSHVYQDHLGYWTIGFGRMVDKRRGGGITRAEAEYLLKNDIMRTYASLRTSIRGFDQLPANVKRALINMAFQMGVDGLLSFENTLRLLEAGDYHAAADEALNSLWYKQTPERAKRVTDWMRV